MNNVLEHVPDPAKEFANIKRLLAKNGEAIIGVPNINGLLFKIFKNKWAELDLPRHLFLFNEKTLKNYATRNSLKISHVRYNCVPFEFTGSIFYFLNKFRKPKKLAQSIIANYRFINVLFLPLCHIFSLLRIGGRIEITFKHVNAKRVA